MQRDRFDGPAAQSFEPDQRSLVWLALAISVAYGIYVVLVSQKTRELEHDVLAY